MKKARATKEQVGACRAICAKEKADLAAVRAAGGPDMLASIDAIEDAAQIAREQILQGALWQGY